MKNAQLQEELLQQTESQNSNELGRMRKADVNLDEVFHQKQEQKQV
jgi:hypothetical protein